MPWNNTITKWTDSRIAELRVFILEENKSATQAANAFRERGFIVTRNAVVGKMWRHGFKSKWLAHRPTPIKKIAVPRPAVPRQPKEPKTPKLITNAIPSMAALVNAPAPLRTPLTELTSLQCRWMLDEKDDYGLALFCGNFAADGRWCEHHHARCNIPYRRAS